MKFTLSWLKEHLETSASLEEIVLGMTMAGLEVEEVVDPARRLSAFSAARITAAEKHPNADRLRVCRVETVDGLKEIVCGAPNARAGIGVIYAPLGAFIPGSGITLEARKVRGVVSAGMLCSAAELEIAEDADGIVELAGDVAIGASAAEALGLEAVIDFEATPNRPDWLGVAGIARDLAAAGLGRFRDQPAPTTAGAFAIPIEIRLASTELCPAFAGRFIRCLRNGPSPEWLQKQLRAVGLRSINALVDITNFLTLDRARPLHVYDAAKLSGGFIEVRAGRTGERLAALDGKTYEIEESMCIIADGSGAIGLGGVMGGASTGCSEATTEVFIESAWFDPIATARTGRTTGIVSDAQYRFARGVDPGSLEDGIERASALILRICGGEPSKAAMAGTRPPPLPPITFDSDLVARLAGLSVPEERIEEIFSELGFAKRGRTFAPPSWRRDVFGPAGLVEEVARIVGYSAIPSTRLPDQPRASGALGPEAARRRRARRALAAQGYLEAVTWSFISKEAASAFGGGGLELENPLSPDLAVLRPSVLPGLIAAAGRNQRRGLKAVALFEIGPVFEGEAPEDQKNAIAAVLAPGSERRWDRGAGEDLFTLKGDLEALLEEIGAPLASLRIEPEFEESWRRPGRGAALMLGRVALAHFGEVHPAIVEDLEAQAPLFAFEVRLEALPEARRKGAKTRPALKLSPFMPLSRDFAFVVEEGIAAGDLVRAAKSVDRELIAAAHVFDVWRGEGLAEGFKSVALEIVIQPTRASLAEAEIEALGERITAAVRQATGAKLRGA
ncbi:MAG: phenylalanine--tRNA ligase subunit beta [Caulobacteraceae bacterium]